MGPWSRRSAPALLLLLLPCLSYAAEGNVSNSIGLAYGFGIGGPALTASINHPYALAGAPDGTMFAVGRYDNTVYRIAPNMSISTVSTPLQSGTNPPVILYANGYLYGWDSTLGRVRMPVAGGAKVAVNIQFPSLVVVSDGTNLYYVYRSSFYRYIDPVAGTKQVVATIETRATDWTMAALYDGGLYAFATDKTVRLDLTSLSTSVLPGVPFGSWPNRRSGAFDGTWVYLAESDLYGGSIMPQTYQIRRHRLSDGFTDVLVGGAKVGDVEGARADATFYYTWSMLFQNGKLYVADTMNNKIKTVDRATGEVATVAGGGVPFIGQDQSLAFLKYPVGVTADKRGALYVADNGWRKVFKVEVDGRVTALAGSGSPGTQDGVGAAASFWWFNNLVAGGDYLYVTDSNMVRRIHTETGQVETLAGGGQSDFGCVDGAFSVAKFNQPWGMAVSGNLLYVADSGNNVIREMNLASRTVQTLAGAAGMWEYADGVAAAARFRNPYGVALYGDYLIYRGRIQ